MAKSKSPNTERPDLSDSKKGQRATSATKKVAKKERIYPGLTETQEEAVLLLSQKLKLKDVATSLGVDRTTLFRWKKQQNFQEALQSELEFVRNDRALTTGQLCELAVAAISKNLTSKNPHIPTAITLLKETGYLERFQQKENTEVQIEKVLDLLTKTHNRLIEEYYEN